MELNMGILPLKSSLRGGKRTASHLEAAADLLTVCEGVGELTEASDEEAELHCEIVRTVLGWLWCAEEVGALGGFLPILGRPDVDWLWKKQEHSDYTQNKKNHGHKLKINKHALPLYLPNFVIQSYGWC